MLTTLAYWGWHHVGGGWVRRWPTFPLFWLSIIFFCFRFFFWRGGWWHRGWHRSYGYRPYGYYQSDARATR